MFMNIKTHKLFSMFMVIVLTLAITATPLMAANSVKVTPYLELEGSHLYTDEIAYVSSYLVNRAVMLYELAILTGNLNYLKEIKPLFDSVSSYLVVVKNTANCSAYLAGVVDDIDKYFVDNNKIIDSILASNPTNGAYNTAQLDALLAEIDSLNDVVTTTINPVVVPSQIDLMSVGNMAITLHLKANMLVRAIYTYAVPSTVRQSGLKKIITDSDYYLDFFKTQAEKSIAKVTIVDQKVKRQSLLDNTTDVSVKSDALVQKISKFPFPSTPSLNLTNSFLRNLLLVDTIITGEILGAVFT